MKKRSIILISILLIILLAVMYYFISGKKDDVVTLEIVKPHYGYIAKSVTSTGTVEPVDTVIVGAQISGVVKKVYVDFNSVVKKGELLAKIDPSITAAQAQQAQANLDNAKSNLEYQQSNYGRQNSLYKLGAISKSDYQIALNQYNSAKSAVSSAAAQLKLASQNLTYTNIYSPINGVVLNRNVREGQTIASSFNAPTLFVLAKDLTQMQVRAAVDEADIGNVRAGQNVSFTVDAFPDDIFKGKVLEILLHPVVSANVVTYTTLINVDNKEMKLKPGMTASSSIYTKEEPHALLVPSKALNFKPDSSLNGKYIIKRLNSGMKQPKEKISGNMNQSFVWVQKGDTIIQKQIFTSLNDDSNVAVEKGLTQDDVVIIASAGSSQSAATDNANRSPFMPQMRRKPPA
ncbi:MAG TPA: efflux RND transporter periplasmic adaptor subunit, partial [Daejeonella sp.]|nr:efflux RND transporter periplasmic adaptor subunit [Daejeonella sp.]